MTDAARQFATARRRRRVVAVLACTVIAVVASYVGFRFSEAPVSGATVGERVAALKVERARLQARADGEARITLLPAFRIASLLLDALAVRAQAAEEEAFDRLPEHRRQAFVDVEALNVALRDALERPGEGARLAAVNAAGAASAALERLIGVDEAPLILSFTPRFVPPRRDAGLTLDARAAGTTPQDGSLRLGGYAEPTRPGAASTPAMPRYAPGFATAGEEDPAIRIEIVGAHLAPQGAPLPVLTIGSWRGQATIAPERLYFSVPRAAFATDVARTTFATGTLSMRGSRPSLFELLFTVLPDRPGSFALDQRVNTTTLESNTLVSPEILARAPAGETRTVRRCFDPPPGWRFDPSRQRVVVVERLGWENDLSDPSLNSGSVEFIPAEQPQQVCVSVIARPVVRTARTATIGRFEATLVRDLPAEKVVKSGVRALDWGEAARLEIEPGLDEWKLYFRLFDDIDREYSGQGGSGFSGIALPFVHIDRDDNGRVLLLRADPTAIP